MTGSVTAPAAAESRAAMVERVMTDERVTGRWPAALLAPWRDALATVPRHRFVPARVYVPHPDGGRPPLVPLHRDDDPERWLRIAYGAEPPGWVVTQVDDGDPAGPDGGGVAATSSASAPAIVAAMLAALDAQPGERVCEIGTGTGYNAALLAHQLGAERVSTVEVDPVIGDAARRALRAAGYGGVRVVTGDGADGYPPGAPFDRLVATVAPREIPPAWIAQTRPGGRVVVPYRNDYTGALVALTVGEDGTATGPVVDDAAFMWMRADREPGADSIGGDEEVAAAERTVGDLHPYWIGGDRGAQFAIGQWVPDCQHRYEPDGDGDALWLLDFRSRSWAKIEHHDRDAGTFPVLQYGPRRLFDEARRAHAWWVDHDRPGIERWQFTVTAGGQRIALAE
ncbi:MAG TPA: methyltransferase domain-containing protein [Pseudonocardiaceae bacterium]|jgi:protein-L-isoaspartate(D-aspartate) O-methyltransferase